MGDGTIWVFDCWLVDIGLIWVDMNHWLKLGNGWGEKIYYHLEREKNKYLNELEV